MDKSLNKVLKLGIFIIVGTILFIAGVYFIGEKQNMFGNTYNIYAVFNNINGLKPGNNVRYSGINVGTVKEIVMVSDTVIVVKIAIVKEITKHIKTDAKCAITSDGLVGSMIINILPGHKSEMNIAKGDTIRSFTRIRTEEMLQTLSVTNENAALLTGELLAITKEISAGKGIVGSMLKDTLLTKDLREIVHHLKITSKASSSTINQLNKILTSIDKKDNLVGMLRDTSVANKVKNIITNVEKSSRELDKVIDHLDLTIHNANQTITNVKDGKGAINYLSNDPSLVTKIDQTIGHLDSTVIQINNAGEKLNENLEALKNTWLLRKYFKNQEKEKEGN
ncbi:MAG: MCE family protein [Saprospiraceae bacterium]|nr:MCE family protein [Saprospiraceae bacterium]